MILTYTFRPMLLFISSKHIRKPEVLQCFSGVYKVKIFWSETGKKIENGRQPRQFLFSIRTEI